MSTTSPSRAVDAYCRCTRCKTPERIPRGYELPRHWERRYSDQGVIRDLCRECLRAVGR